MRATAPSTSALLARHEGESLHAAPDAILKGLLEAEAAANLVAGPETEPFDALFRRLRDEAAAEILRAHDLVLKPTPSSARAVTLAGNAARSGRGAVALVPNEELDAAADAITRVTGDELGRGGALCLLLEDRPSSCPRSCPRRFARRLDLPCVEASTVGDLRDAFESVLRLSRAGRCAIGLIAHVSILRSAETIVSRPNRVIESVDAMLARRRRRRRPRLAESSDVLRMVRRLELNRSSGLPSPGERTPIGFITAGPAAGALGHLLHVLNLAGRVPAIHLGVVNPIDDAAVARLLGRCDQVVVLESRPGSLEEAIFEVVEAMRRKGERPAAVWGRTLPPDPEGREHRLGLDHALHPSLLARRMVHLLHMIRPTGRIASQLVPDLGRFDSNVPARGAALGPAAAIARLRRLAADADQWLREHVEDNEAAGLPPTALAVDGLVPASAPERLVMVESWAPDLFRREGIAAVRQAARDERPWIFLVCDFGGEDEQDLERMVRGVIPADRAERVRIVRANLSDTEGLGEAIRESANVDGLTVVLVGDGPPAIYDPDALERSLGEIDRLGFEPSQRRAWPVDAACAVRPPVPGEERGEPRAGSEVAPIRTSVRLDRVPRHGGGRVLARVRPFLEQVTVTRTRPPAGRWRRDPSSRLPLPDPVHRQAARWRAHLAGYRGDAPGVAAGVLCAAGRTMGYAVGCAHDPTPIGAGRRAWAQVLFTRPRDGEPTHALTVRVPFGDADVLLGLDATETVRAVATDPALRVAVDDGTFAVVNTGGFVDEGDDEQGRELRRLLSLTVRDVSRAEGRLADDFAGACRAWFHTDRVVDLALLGAAFQSGLIPVTLDAIESAVAETEAAGFGRSLDAFQLGRHLAVDHHLFSRPREEGADDVDRIVRRLVHQKARQRRRRDGHAKTLGRLIEDSLEGMPGLTETDLGRQARRDFTVACDRCYHWGGLDHATRYAQLVTDLYRADRGDSGRAMTRNAVLPLAGAMLVRDPIFISSMATSAEQRRRTRQALNVKRARGDELERRYLTRLEVIALGRRLRAFVRTSDWPIRIVASLHRVVPRQWRGSRRERELRDYLVELAERASARADEDYERLAGAFHRLHQQALDNRLRGMALAEVRMLVEGSDAAG